MTESNYYTSAASDRLDDRVTFLVEARYFPLLHSIQADPKIHPPSYPMGIWGFLPGAKRLRREADQSSRPSAEVRNCGATSLLLVRLHVVCLIN
jgi:hypothetical protein